MPKYNWLIWIIVYITIKLELSSFVRAQMFRSSHPEVFLGKGVLKICSKFTGEHPCRSAISTAPVPRNTSGRLFLNV